MKASGLRVLSTVIFSIAALAALQCSGRNPASPQGEESVQECGFVQFNIQISKPVAQVIDRVVVIAENTSTGQVAQAEKRIYSKSTTILLQVPVGSDWIVTARAYSGSVLCFQGQSSQTVDVGAGRTVTVEIDATDVDEDQDGLSSWQELSMGTDPSNPDTDGDSLKDGEEVDRYKSDPTKADTDNDGLKDGKEVQLGTDLLDPDTDDDTFLDGEDLFPTGNAQIQVVLEKLALYGDDGESPTNAFQIYFEIFRWDEGSNAWELVLRLPRTGYQQFFVKITHSLDWKDKFDVDDNVREHRVAIGMWDKDFSLFGADDLCDLNGSDETKFLTFRYDLKTLSSSAVADGRKDGISTADTDEEDGYLEYAIKTVF